MPAISGDEAATGTPPGGKGGVVPPSVSFKGPAARLDAYEPVAAAIEYLVANRDAQPSLDDVAAQVGLSPAHFQKVFKSGAGVSPKRFLQQLAAADARRALIEGGAVLDAAYAAGLSGPSRLHDLFIVCEAMTPGAFRRKGEGETIRYAAARGPFGETLIGATDKGICWLSFPSPDGFDRSIAEMQADWPAANFRPDAEFVAPLAAQAFAFACGDPAQAPLRLHVQGTNFQLKVWEALLRIPHGRFATYGQVAAAVGSPSASRAVGAAVGANSVSLLIPCHRVILASGAIHNYRWGAARKRALIALETARA
ncbi:MAG: methylated-DNA--[protein]-cysteine S-methyltransferase [Alphaproteobacteria bacterium]|nr:methylated-DNA--[protein]-cysteine S-methyltransferase [Alphaproteobacteria bacterium]